MIAFVSACFMILGALLVLAYREVRRQNILIGHLIAAIKRRPTYWQIERIIETTQAVAGATATARNISNLTTDERPNP